MPEISTYIPRSSCVHFFYKILYIKYIHPYTKRTYRKNKKILGMQWKREEKNLCTFFSLVLMKIKKKEKKLLFATFGKGARKKVSKHVAL